MVSFFQILFFASFLVVNVAGLKCYVCSDIPNADESSDIPCKNQTSEDCPADLNDFCAIVMKPNNTNIKNCMSKEEAEKTGLASNGCIEEFQYGEACACSKDNCNEKSSPSDYPPPVILTTVAPSSKPTGPSKPASSFGMGNKMVSNFLVASAVSLTLLGIFNH